MIREKNPNKPLFFYLPLNAVHGPYQLPEKYCATCSNFSNLATENPGKLAELRAKYDAMMRSAVHNGEVPGGLKE